MKKTLAILLALSCLFGLVGCGDRSMDDIIENEPSITGVVMEVDEYSFLMLGEPNEMYSTAEEYSVSLKAENEDSYTSVSVGDEVVVYHNGEIAESDPLQINTVYAITLKTPANFESELTADEIEWLEWFTSLSKEEQAAVSTIPDFYYEIYSYPEMD